MNKAESWLESTLQYRFQNVELFRQALTHRSATNFNNERLEFLGDAVLDFVVSDVLFEARPDAPEGDLSKLRAALVKDKTLAQIALELGIGEHLILGSGELKTGGHRRESILADAVEALFAAIFLDRGIGEAQKVINRVYEQRYQELPEVAELRDPKTRLQEWLQGRKMELPKYELIDETGKDHKKRFAVSCTVEEKSAVTEGESTTRRKAEQKAARKMIELIIE